jgi:hypothetical protein
MLAIALLVAGGTLMLTGVLMLWEWLGGESKLFDADSSWVQADWLLLDIRFIALVIAPMLFGAILIVFGMARL